MVFNERFSEAQSKERRSTHEIFFWPVLCIKCNCVIRVCCCCRVFLGERKNCSRIFVFFFLIIVKSLQLCGRRQIAEPRKYCLVRVIILFGVCFLYFFVSHRLGFRLNSLQIYHIIFNNISINFQLGWILGRVLKLNECSCAYSLICDMMI